MKIVPTNAIVEASSAGCGKYRTYGDSTPCSNEGCAEKTVVFYSTDHALDAKFPTGDGSAFFRIWLPLCGKCAEKLYFKAKGGE